MIPIPRIRILDRGQEVVKSPAGLDKVKEIVHQYSVDRLHSPQIYTLSLTSSPVPTDQRWVQGVIEEIASYLQCKPEDISVEVAVELERIEKVGPRLATVTDATEGEFFRAYYRLAQELLSVARQAQAGDRSVAQALLPHAEKMNRLNHLFRVWGGPERLDQLERKASDRHLLFEIANLRTALQELSQVLERAGLVRHSEAPRLRRRLLENRDPAWQSALRAERVTKAELKRLVSWYEKCDNAHEALYTAKQAYEANPQRKEKAYRKAQLKHKERLDELAKSTHRFASIQRAIDAYYPESQRISLTKLRQDVVGFARIPPEQIVDDLGVSEAEREGLIADLEAYQKRHEVESPNYLYALDESDRMRANLYLKLQRIPCQNEAYRAFLVDFLKEEMGYRFKKEQIKRKFPGISESILNARAKEQHEVAKKLEEVSRR